MTKKIHVSLFICSIAILLYLPSVFGNVGTYNPSNNNYNNHPNQDPHNPLHTQVEDDEEKEMLKELMGDFDSPVDHKREHHTGASDNFNNHGFGSHDQLVNHEREQGHHEDYNNGHNQPKNRNPLHDRIKAEPHTDIKELEIKIDGTVHTYNVFSCTYLKVPIHHGNIDVLVSSLGNADKAMLTTTHVNNCSELMQFHCRNHTAFCQIHNLQHETDMKIYHSIADANEAYLYVLPHTISEPLSFKVKVSPAPEIQIKELPTANDMCHTRNFDTCEENPDVCHSRCLWYPCAYAAEGNVNIAGGVCVSTGSDLNLAQKSCLNFPDYAAAPQAHRLKVNVPTCQYTPVEALKSHTFLAVTIFFTLFMACVCFYRYQFKRYGEGFFSPPSFCPKFLFPRKEELQTSFYKDIVKNSELEMDYQPPVL